ncbi:MAG: thioredoxin family protein, partial [Planctomycetales bacterium]|nr:thioredoxin family protein [Planctomycetales bacterium]
PYVPPTLDDRVQQAFAVAGTPAERLAKATELIQTVNQNLLIVFADPKDPRVRRLMEIRYEDKDFRAYSDDFRFMAIPTDGDKRPAALALAQTLKLDLTKNPSGLYIVLLDHNARLLAVADETQLCKDDEFSKERFLEMLDPHRTKPLDAQKLLDDALAKATQENKRVLIQETATWCGPCHRLSRLLSHNRQWEQDYIWVKIDQRWTGAADVMERLRAGAEGGIPWFAILDAKGNKLATSNLPDSGNNIGFPAEPSGAEHFANMLKSTKIRMSDEEIETLTKAAASE